MPQAPTKVQSKDGVTLQGEGAEATIITTSGGEAIITIANVESGAIDGFTIDGGGAVNVGFDLSQSTVTITNNVITNVTSHGLFAWLSTPTISNNQFVNNGDAGQGNRILIKSILRK